MFPSRFQILDRVHTSARSTIFRAWDDSGAREVAIKTRPAALENFYLREVAALRRVRHPGVVELLESAATPEGSYLVVEWLSGTTLESRLEHGTVPIADLGNLARQGLEALDVIHKVGLIHRDVTPANLMLTQVLKLIDFELSHPLQTGAPEDGAVGTVQYMAPEQFRKRPLDARCDLYAFGTVLYQAACGIAPFPGTEAAQIITAHLYHQPASPRRIRPDLPSSLANLIDRLLQRDPEARPPSAAAALGFLHKD